MKQSNLTFNYHGESIPVTKPLVNALFKLYETVCRMDSDEDLPAYARKSLHKVSKQINSLPEEE